MKEVNEPLMASFEEARATFSASAKGNRRGDFASMVCGISHGGGQKVCGQLMLSSMKYTHKRTAETWQLVVPQPKGPRHRQHAPAPPCRAADRWIRKQCVPLARQSRLSLMEAPSCIPALRAPPLQVLQLHARLRLCQRSQPQTQL